MLIKWYNYNKMFHLGSDFMLKKKTMGILLTVSVISILACIASVQIIAQQNSNYKIHKYNNLDTVAWLNNNEVLALKVKSGKKVYADKKDHPRDFTYEYIKSISIFNVNTGKRKDYKEVNVGVFKGVSPNGEYALYQEPREIPETGSTQYKLKSKSGELRHATMKILNLNTGKILPFNPANAPFINSDDQYFWVDDNKIIDWSLESKKWQISNVNGKVYIDSPIETGSTIDDCLVGSDIKISGDNISGCLYIHSNKNQSEHTTIKTLDINTNKLTNIIDSELYLQFKKQDGAILTCSVRSKNDRHRNTVKILNEDYSLKKEINLDEVISCFEDGSCYPNRTILYGNKLYFISSDEKLKELSLKTCTINTISNGAVDNLAINKNGTMISYTNGYCTFIVKIKQP